jgi:hypothetical protein
MSMIGDLDTVFREITVQSPLPENPDQELAEELCQSLVFNAIAR